MQWRLHEASRRAPETFLSESGKDARFLQVWKYTPRHLLWKKIWTQIPRIYCSRKRSESRLLIDSAKLARVAIFGIRFTFSISCISVLYGMWNAEDTNKELLPILLHWSSFVGMNVRWRRHSRHSLYIQLHAIWSVQAVRSGDNDVTLSACQTFVQVRKDHRTTIVPDDIRSISVQLSCDYGCIAHLV